MLRLLTLLTVMCYAFTSQDLMASQEGVLIWSDFAMSSLGIGASGPVKVSGKQGSAGIKNLKVEAFGRKFILARKEVKYLQGFFANGMFLSFEQGYKELGGRTIYLSFFRGFTSGIQITKRVAVNERGEFKFLQ